MKSNTPSRGLDLPLQAPTQTPVGAGQISNVATLPTTTLAPKPLPYYPRTMLTAVQFSNSILINYYITIKDSLYHACIDFSFNGRPYTFQVTKWAGTGFAYFLSLFHAYIPRDVNMFGSIGSDGSYLGHTQQKECCVIQACQDVMICLGRIYELHQWNIVDYAIWYRERYRPELNSYSRYITYITCCCIIHQSFMAGSVQYVLIEF
jgi:hypothetical protein